MRLNQIIASAGLTSRRKADEWITAGRVSVNGSPVRKLGTKAVWGTDSIMVDGKEIPGPSERIYVMMNKPFGYICALEEPEGRRLVTDLLEGISTRIYPVGRLDFDSLGLLLLTNDGQLTNRLTHPRYGLPRTYKATIEGSISDEALKKLTRGVNLDDGPSGPSKVAVVSRKGRQSVVRITITQGRNRQVRRMISAVGYDVVHLIRTGFGTLMLGDLKLGRYRHIEDQELRDLKRLVGLK